MFCLNPVFFLRTVWGQCLFCLFQPLLLLLSTEGLTKCVSGGIIKNCREHGGKDQLNESELYKKLGALTKNKDEWENSIPFVASLLSCDSIKVKAKALWLLGEMGLKHPPSIRDCVPAVASFLGSAEPLLRERALNALGRIGRSDFHLVEPYWSGLFRFAADQEANVRLSFIWASENIAANTPDPYENFMAVFAELLHDRDDRVRMEAPEMFRVLGKRRPEFVRPYLNLLRAISETDRNRVVRIHCAGAARAAGAEGFSGNKTILS